MIEFPGYINGYVPQYPHCDMQVLHAPGNCKYCDAFPDAQQTRIKKNINFTGCSDPGKSQCPAEAIRSLEVINAWHGNVPEPYRKKN